MGSPDDYGTTGDTAGHGISPFDGPYVAPRTTLIESTATRTTHPSMTDRTNSLASLSEGPSLAGLADDRRRFGGHRPPQELSGFPYYSDAIGSIAMDPSLFGQLALAYSPLASPGGAVGADEAGHLLTPEGPSYLSPLSTQESPYPETSPATHAWIAGIVYRSGMWPQPQNLLPQLQCSTERLENDQMALMLSASGYDETPGPIWTPGASVAGKTSSASFASAVHHPGRSPQQHNPPPQSSCSTDHLQDDQISLMFGAADYDETTGSIWNPSLSVTGATSVLASPSQGGSSTAGEGASPVKVRRRRGRPRLYEIDVIEVPKRKPGRPLTYGPVAESFGSRLSMPSSSPTMSPGSVEGSRTPFWEGPSSGGAARSAKRNEPADESTKQDPAEAAAQAVVRIRNKAAATRYRLKTQQTVERVEVEERGASLRRQALLACADRLRGELHDLKTEVMQHANCGCPYISRYISATTQHTLAAITGSPASPAPVSPSAQELTSTLPFPHLHLASCTWQQGGIVAGAPVPSPYYAASLSSSGVTGQAPSDVDGYFGSSMSSSNANDEG